MSRTSSAVAGFLVALAVGWFPPQAEATVLQWFYGALNSQIGTDYACLSDPPIFESRVAGYSAYTYWPPYQPTNVPFAQLPGVGEVFYAKPVLSHPGNPCAGSAVGIELLLPSGVTTAVSAANPVFCFARVPPNQQHADYRLINLGNDSGYGCPQAFSQGLEGLAVRAPNGGLGGGSWGMFAGSWLEFLIPLKSSVPQNGSKQIYFRINPDIAVVGYTNELLYVNSDTIFRAAMEDTNLTLDLCKLGPVATGC